MNYLPEFNRKFREKMKKKKTDIKKKIEFKIDVLKFNSKYL
jgi:hypothetical protein